MSFLDSIFGGESTKGIKFQKAENDRKREAIDFNRDMGIDFIREIIPGGISNLNEGYSKAVDAARRGPQAQMEVLQNSGQRAQESVLAGMGEYRRAIMGLPSQQDPNNYYNNRLGLRPIAIGGDGNAMQPFWNTKKPDFLPRSPAPGQAAQSVPAQSMPSQSAQPQMTEEDIARILGGISRYDMGTNLR
jgi:hypothetical protein